MPRDQALEALENRIRQLTARLETLEDVHAIRTLHFAYGYYIDMCLYEEACDLFSSQGAVRFLNGLYKGTAGVQRLYLNWFRQQFTGGRNGPVYGLLLDHLMAQDVVTISPDRTTARARFRALNMIGYHDSKPEPLANMPQQFWGAGIYENVYVRENGVWKIQFLDYAGRWQAPYEQGWAHGKGHLTLFETTYPENPVGPDEILPGHPGMWPESRVVPFHYVHPVTGKRWESEEEEEEEEEEELASSHGPEDTR
jgi:hypothetical protein